MRLFVKTLIGGFNCVNTRLAFDTNILLKDTDQEKILFDINIGGKKQLKRFLSVILKITRTISMEWPLQSHCHMGE